MKFSSWNKTLPEWWQDSQAQKNVAREKPLCNNVSMPKKISDEVTNYMRQIGAKGGAKGKGSPLRKELNTKAAHARWRKLHPPPKKI